MKPFRFRAPQPRSILRAGEGAELIRPPCVAQPEGVNTFCVATDLSPKHPSGHCNAHRFHRTVLGLKTSSEGRFFHFFRTRSNKIELAKNRSAAPSPLL